MFENTFGYPKNVATLNLVESLAWAMHELKYKPWKQAPKDTQVANYQHKLLQVLFDYIEYARSYDLDPEGLFNLYMGKSKVNKERIANGV